MPEFEEREAAVFAHIPWPAWSDMSVTDRAAVVAHYRLHGIITSNVTDVIERENQRRSKKRRPNGV